MRQVAAIVEIDLLVVSRGGGLDLAVHVHPVLRPEQVHVAAHPEEDQVDEDPDGEY